MIGDLLTSIKDAENNACQVIDDARVKAEKIQADANAEIDRINSELEEAVAKILIKTQKTPDEQITTEPITIEVPKDRTDAAVNFIVKEFSKRFSK